MLYRNRILKGGVAASVAVAIAVSATAFASNAEIQTAPVAVPASSSEPAVDAKMAMPYPGPTAFEYVLPEKAKEKFSSATKALYAVKCDAKKALSSAGISSSGKEILSFSVSNGEYEESYDLKNCSMSLYRTKNSYWNETLTKEEALASAKAFFDKEIVGRGASYGEFGKPRATANGGYGIAVPYAKDAAVSSAIPEEVEIEDDGNGEVPVSKEATGYSVFYPYLLKGVPLYDSYGNDLGVRFEVGSTGVNSASVPLLKFKLAKRTSEKMSAEDFEAFVKRGGNSPYYGSDGGKVELSNGTPAFSTIQLWRGGKTETYLSTATRFASGKKNPYQDSDYGIVVPHFSIGDSQKQ